MSEANPPILTAETPEQRLERWKGYARSDAKTVNIEVFREVLAQLDNVERHKDAAYLERNRLVALLARIFPSGIARTAIEGWSEDWHGCVYIDLPTGQASWHFHDSQAHLFKGLPPYLGKWDGHTTEEKYERVAKAPALDFTTWKSLISELAALRSRRDAAGKESTG